MNFQSFFKELKRNWILSAVVTCVLGLILVLWPDWTLGVVCYVFGALAVVMGVVRTVRYFKKDHTYPFLFQSDLVVGLLTMGMGIFMLRQPDVVSSLLPYLFGILLVGCGIGNALRSLDAKEAGFTQWGVLLGLACLSILLGLVICINPFPAITTTIIVIGAGLIYEGVTDIVTTLLVSKRIEAWKKTQEQQN